MVYWLQENQGEAVIALCSTQIREGYMNVATMGGIVRASVAGSNEKSVGRKPLMFHPGIQGVPNSEADDVTWV